MSNFTPLVNLATANAATFNAPLTQLDDAIEGLTTGDKELTSPDIISFTNAQHDHTDAAGGGLLPFDALDASGADEGDVLQVSGGVVVAAPLSIPSGTPSGAVQMFAGSSAPSGWLLCYGQAVDRTTYADLFTAISTTYGVGDGSTTFNLPDLRGRVPGGLDNMGGSSANRITDVAADSLGGNMGAETHELTTGELAAHAHGPDALDLIVSRAASGTGAIGLNTGGAASVFSQAATTASTGSNTAHNNVQPTLFMNFIIKV